jgi:hypothetical protein
MSTAALHRRLHAGRLAYSATELQRLLGLHRNACFRLAREIGVKPPGSRRWLVGRESLMAFLRREADAKIDGVLVETT